MFFTMFLNILFLNSNNPLTLGLILLLQTIIITMIIGKLSFTFWFSYIIFLIFIGGMLILFMYVISLLNNYKFYFYDNNKTKLMWMLIIMLLYSDFNFYNYEMNLFNKYYLLNENSFNLIKLYNMPNMLINLLLIIYLFIMMIVSTKMTNISMGPFFKF